MQKHEDNLATQVDGAGLVPMPGVTVTVTDQSTGLAAALYSDNGVTPITAPIVTDNTGYYGFFAADGRYTITFTNPRIVTFTRDVILEDPKDNPYATLAQLAAPTGSTNIGNGTETVSDSFNALQLADYTALRAYGGPRKSVYVTGYLGTAAPSGIAGMFVRDDSDTTTADNGGTVIVASNGKRWRRSAPTGIVYAAWFGAQFDNSTDNYAAITAAISALGTNGGTVMLPQGTGRYGTKITISTPVILRGVGRAAYLTAYATRLTKTGDFVGIEFAQGSAFGGLRDLTVDAAVTNTTDGVYVTSGRIDVDKITIQGQGRHGMNIRDGNASSLNDIQSINNVGDGIHVEGQGVAPDTNGMVFRDLDLRVNGGHGLNIYTGFSNFVFGIIAQGNGGSAVSLNDDDNRIFGLYSENNTGKFLSLTANADRNMIFCGTVSDWAAPANLGTNQIILGADANSNMNLGTLLLQTKLQLGNTATGAPGYVLMQDTGTGYSVTVEGTNASMTIPLFKSSGTGKVTVDPDAIAIDATTLIGSAGAPAFLNGWVSHNTSGSSSRKPAGYYKDKFGNIRGEGSIKSGTIGAAVFTLPAGSRPSGRVQFPAASFSGATYTPGHIIVDSDGNVYANVGGNTEFSLDTICFKTAP